jgi:effector-binding domain-containing protein
MDKFLFAFKNEIAIFIALNYCCMKKYLLLTCITAQLFAACSSNEKKKAEPEAKKDSGTKKEEPAAPPAANKRPAIINITDTLSAKQVIIYMKDSAATVERLQRKLSEIWGVKLGAVVQKNKIKVTGHPTAWYKTHKAPYFFEAGIPVDKKPAKFPSNVFVREIGIDSVTVAHFYGSYDLLPQAYEALNDWMKGHKKKLDSKPYEVYVDDPMDKDGKMKNPYKVLTDVIYPWK